MNMFWDALALGAAVVAPLGLALLMLPRTWRKLMARAVPWMAFPALVTALVVPSGTAVEWNWLVLGTHFGLDETGRAFLLLTAVLWLIAAFFTLGYMTEDRRRGRFLLFFLLAMSGNFGLILALDIAAFYAFFALMSFASYGLVIHNRDEEALRAGRIYIYLVIVGELMLFAGLVMMAVHAGDMALPLDAAAAPGAFAAGLVFLGFGIKAGLIFLHIWLPLAHPVAPTPASAVLSGAMIKAGIIGWMRFLPMDGSVHPAWGYWLIVMGITAAFYGVLAGLAQRNPKTLLAYSSISQMGLITVGVGAGFAAPGNWTLAWPAVLIYALHHGFAKGALFLGVGIAGAAGSHARLWVKAGLVLPALALAGGPLTSGMIAKAALKPAVEILPAEWPVWIAFLLSLAAVGTTLLMTRFLYLTWPRETGKGSLTPGMWVPWWGLVVISALMLFVWPLSSDLAYAYMDPGKWWPALWPVLTGVVISVSVWRLFSHRFHMPLIPAGDLLVLIERAGRFRGRHPFEIKLLRGRKKISPAIQRLRKGTVFAGWLAGGEGYLCRWQTSVFLFLFLSLLFSFLLMI